MSEFRPTDRDQDYISGTMSTPADQALIPIAEEKGQPMEVNGTNQHCVVPRVQEPAEEAAGAVIEQSQEQPGTSALD